MKNIQPFMHGQSANPADCILTEIYTDKYREIYILCKNIRRKQVHKKVPQMTENVGFKPFFGTD